MPDIRKQRKRLDSIFSKYIRLRDSDSKGYVNCITCGSRFYYTEVDCGHFITRKEIATRFDERNCNAQCRKCNSFLAGNIEVYEKMVDKKWGEGTAEELRSMRNTLVRLSSIEYDELIKEYSHKLKELQDQKGIIR